MVFIMKLLLDKLLDT